MLARRTTTFTLVAALLLVAACGETTRDTAGSERGRTSGSGGGSGEEGSGGGASISGGSGEAAGSGGAELGARGGVGAGGLAGLTGDGGADNQNAICTFIAPLLLPVSVRQDEVTCEVSVTAAEPCVEAARCLCGEGANPAVDPSEVENCVGWYFEPRGDITFLDVCRTSHDQYMQSLADALSDLLAGQVTTSPECDDTPAIYGW